MAYEYSYPLLAPRSSTFAGWDGLLDLTDSRLCQECQLSYGGLNFEQLDHYPAFSNLKRRSDSGCGFCRFVLSCLVADMTWRPWEHHLDSMPAPFPVWVSLRFDISSRPWSLLNISHSLYQEPWRWLNVNSTFDYDELENRKHSMKREDTIRYRKALEKIGRQLQECEQHSLCSEMRTDFVPSRLVDITSGADLLRLESPTGCSRRYASLSYCWGKPRPNTTPFVTTRANIHERQTGFSLASLPLTLRDAIRLARDLGFVYIWIDSLCILQDDDDDWSRESAQMGHIYSNAALTLAARAGISSWDGFLERPRPNRQVFRLSYLVGEKTSFSKEMRSLWIYCDGSNGEAINTGAHWNRRGWILQEELLSTRLLHCHGDYGFYFQCLEQKTLLPAGEEWGQRKLGKTPRPWITRTVPVPRSMRTDAARAPQYYEWDEIVTEYCQRYLSYQTDKLPALSGIAEKFATAYNDQYIAGLWRSDLAGLCWSVRTQEDIMAHGGSMEAGPKLGHSSEPSWSWVSCGRSVKWLRSGDIQRVHDDIEIRKVCLTAIGQNPFGSLSSGHLLIYAKLLDMATVFPKVDGIAAVCDIFSDCWIISSYVATDSRESLPLADVRLLFIIEGYRQKHGILLAPANEAESYRRIGRFVTEPEDNARIQECLAQSEAREFRLV